MRGPHVPPQGDRQRQVGDGAGQQRAPAADPAAAGDAGTRPGPATGPGVPAASGASRRVDARVDDGHVGRPRPAGPTARRGRPGRPCRARSVARCVRPVARLTVPTARPRRPRRRPPPRPRRRRSTRPARIGYSVIRCTVERIHGTMAPDPVTRAPPTATSPTASASHAHRSLPTPARRRTGGQRQAADHRQRHGQDQHVEVGAHPVHHGRGARAGPVRGGERRRGAPGPDGVHQDRPPGQHRDLDRGQGHGGPPPAPVPRAARPSRSTGRPPARRGRVPSPAPRSWTGRPPGSAPPRPPGSTGPTGAGARRRPRRRRPATTAGRRTRW